MWCFGQHINTSVLMQRPSSSLQCDTKQFTETLRPLPSSRTAISQARHATALHHHSSSSSALLTTVQAGCRIEAPSASLQEPHKPTTESAVPRTCTGAFFETQSTAVNSSVPSHTYATISSTAHGTSSKHSDCHPCCTCMPPSSACAPPLIHTKIPQHSQPALSNTRCTAQSTTIPHTSTTPVHLCCRYLILAAPQTG